jgi:hypothetical protein
MAQMFRFRVQGRKAVPLELRKWVLTLKAALVLPKTSSQLAGTAEAEASARAAPPVQAPVGQQTIAGAG